MKRRLAAPQMPLEFGDELIVDNFCGGGGASLGIEWGMGRSVNIAINHSPPAINMHIANHPTTQHFCEDVWKIDPRIVTRGRPVGLAWFSPDCKHHSKARGGKPKDKNIRGLAWVATRWAATVRPRVIILENVEEFRHWGPLDPITKMAIPEKKGKTFDHFVRRLQECGYQVEHRELIASDYGAPTSRKRFFLIARCDGRPIVWPEPTHGPGREHPYRTAAECIDWSIPCPSIFERKRPLAENTLKRIAKGIQKFVIDDPEPFIVDPVAGPFFAPRYGERPGQEPRTGDIHDPSHTITPDGNAHRLVTPIIGRIGHTGWGSDQNRAVDDPLSTIVSKQEHTLVAAFIAKHFGGVTGIRADAQFPTITGRGTQQQVVTSHLMTMRNNVTGRKPDEPLLTITGAGTHHAEVRAFLMKYYGAESGQYQRVDEPIHTIPSKARYGLVTIHGQEYMIVDIGMRMLTPRELFRCQGFPEDYIIDPEFEGKPLNKTLQTMCVGNSVPPQLSEAIVKANFVRTANEGGCMNSNIIELPIGTRECEDCMEIFDIRQENPASHICNDCLAGAVQTVCKELTQRGMTIPACLEPRFKEDNGQ